MESSLASHSLLDPWLLLPMIVDVQGTPHMVQQTGISPIDIVVLSHGVFEATVVSSSSGL